MLSDTEFEQICTVCDLPSPLACAEQDAAEILDEADLTELMWLRSARDNIKMDFLAAGSYRHFIPAKIRAQKLLEPLRRRFAGQALDADYARHAQSLRRQLCDLSALPGCALLQQDLVTSLLQLLMACNQPGKVLIAATVAPGIRQALRSRLKYLDIDLVVVDYDKQTGAMTLQQLQAYANDHVSAVIMAWPNFFSILEPVDQVSHWVKSRGASLILLTEALTMNLLESPCNALTHNVDFMLGDFASISLAPNRQGCAPSFVLAADTIPATVQQSASRQTLAEMAQIDDFMSMLARQDEQQGIHKSRRLLARLLRQLSEIDRVAVRFSSPGVLECVVQLEGIDLQNAQRILAGHNILPGYSLADDYPELQDCLLLSCADSHNEADIDKFCARIATVVKNLSTAGCPVKPKFD